MSITRRNIRDIHDVRVPTYGPDSAIVVIAYGNHPNVREVALHVGGSALSVLGRESLKALKVMVVHAESNLQRAKEGA